MVVTSSIVFGLLLLVVIWFNCRIGWKKVHVGRKPYGCTAELDGEKLMMVVNHMVVMQNRMEKSSCWL